MIPSTLHQFWDTGAPPAAVSALMNTWRQYNPNWEYRLWSDKSALKLIDDYFDQRIKSAYEQCAVPAMRADIARYLILYMFGGIYADADISCLKPLDEVVDPNVEALVFKGWNGAWRTDFMGASAGNVMMAEIIEATIDNVHRRSSDNLWLVTGPGATTPIVQKYVTQHSGTVQTFEFLDVKEKILTFHHQLDYRSEGRHWAEEQQRSSIFRDALSQS